MVINFLSWKQPQGDVILALKWNDTIKDLADLKNELVLFAVVCFFAGLYAKGC